MNRCQECNGRFDRPGLFKCDAERHPQPTVAQHIVSLIEEDLRNRKGLRQCFEGLDEDIQDDIRDIWVELINIVIGYDEGEEE